MVLVHVCVLVLEPVLVVLFLLVLLRLLVGGEVGEGWVVREGMWLNLVECPMVVKFSKFSKFVWFTVSPLWSDLSDRGRISDLLAVFGRILVFFSKKKSSKCLFVCLALT